MNYFTTRKIELGTEDYPYKYLDHAIYDEYNFPSSLAASINIRIIGSYSYDIDFPIVIQTSQLTINAYGSSSKLNVNLYPNTMKDKGFTTIGGHYRARGPESYNEINFHMESPYINIYETVLTLNNLNFLAGTRNVDTFSNFKNFIF